MKRVSLNDAMVALSLVHFGQQLGTDSTLAQAISNLARLLACFFDLVS
jgi:small basic protein